MGKIYLLGGENVFQRSAKEVNEQAFEDAGSRPEVLVFPWARASFDKTYQKRKLLKDYLRSLGASNVDFANYSDRKETTAEKITASRIVYLTGGQPSILVERLKTTGVDELLKIYNGIVVGRSAGALALCSRFVATVRNSGRVKIDRGISLVDVTLKVHYETKNDEALKRFSQKEQIFAVPKDSALVYDNGKLSSAGEVFLFKEGKQHDFVIGDL